VDNPGKVGSPDRAGNPGKVGSPDREGNPGSKAEAEGKPGSKAEAEGSLPGVDTVTKGTGYLLADTRTSRPVGSLGTRSLAPPLAPYITQLETRAPPWPSHMSL